MSPRKRGRSPKARTGAGSGAAREHGGGAATAAGDAAPDGPRSLGFAALALGALLALFAAYLVYAAFPGRGSGLPLRDGVGRTIDRFLPQGWAFFTADPGADVYLPYKPGGLAGLQWMPASVGPLARAANGFGFDRSPRLQDQQVQSVVAGIQGRYWHSCPPDLALAAVSSCLAADPTIVTATNPWPVPALCGRVGVVAAMPVAWSVAHSGGPTFDATAVLVAELSC